MRQHQHEPIEVVVYRIDLVNKECASLKTYVQRQTLRIAGKRFTSKPQCLQGSQLASLNRDDDLARALIALDSHDLFIERAEL